MEKITEKNCQTVQMRRCFEEIRPNPQVNVPLWFRPFYDGRNVARRLANSNFGNFVITLHPTEDYDYQLHVFVKNKIKTLHIYDNAQSNCFFIERNRLFQSFDQLTAYYRFYKLPGMDVRLVYNLEPDQFRPKLMEVTARHSYIHRGAIVVAFDHTLATLTGVCYKGYSTMIKKQYLREPSKMRTLRFYW